MPYFRAITRVQIMERQLYCLERCSFSGSTLIGQLWLSFSVHVLNWGFLRQENRFTQFPRSLDFMMMCMLPVALLMCTQNVGKWSCLSMSSVNFLNKMLFVGTQ